MNPVGTATLLGAVAILAGCTNAGSPIFIVQNQVPGEGCVVASGIGSTFTPRGAIDTNASAGYLFTPVVQNLAEEGTGTQGLVFLEGADVEVKIPDGLFGDAAAADAVRADANYQALTKFSKRFSGTIQPNGGTTSLAFTILPLQLMTDFIADHLRDDGTQIVEVQVDVSIFGKLSGGGVDTPTFTYWIDVCNGCMKQNLGACTDLAAGYAGLPGGTCVDLQDDVLECCTAADSSEVCPAAGPTE